MPENSETTPTPKNNMITNAHSYNSPSPDEITIVATGIGTDGPDADRKVIPATLFRELKACNFNAAHLYGNIDDPKKKSALIASLSNAKEEKVNIIAGCYFFNLNHAINPETDLQRAKDFFDFFKDNTHTGNASVIKGWMMRDEPTAEMTQETGVGYNLKTIYEYIRTNDRQERPIQINLLGGMGKGNEAKYKEYLDTFETNFDPNLWSYDLYPITQDSCLINNVCNADNCRLTVNHETFYDDLKTFHERSKATGAVFWAHVQSMEYINGTLYHPAALESYIRFEAFSALAFGAQGIVYWTYRQRSNSDSEVYPSALVDRNGNRMPAWYFARQVNGEILQYRGVFVDSELMKWTHVGEGYGQPVINQSIGALGGITASGIGALITQLRTNGKNYIVIVSHDVEEYQTLDMTFASMNVVELTPTTSRGAHFKEKQIEARSIRRQLIPGGYMIFRY